MATLAAKASFSLDALQESSFLIYYNSLQVSSNVCCKFFDHGEYYSVHGKDALFVAKEYFKTPTRTKYIGKEKLATINLSVPNFEAVAKHLLFSCNYRIEIHQCQKGKGQRLWSLICKASPGNLSQVEDLLFSNSDVTQTSSAVMAVKFTQVTSGHFNVGIGIIDAVQKEVLFSNFQDNELFSNLESVIIQLGAKECLMTKVDSNVDTQKISEVIKRSGVLITEHPRKAFDCKDLEQDLNRLLKKNKKQQSMHGNLSKSISENPLSSFCLAGIINYLELLNKEDHFEQYSLKEHNLGQYMKLDRAAYKALSLFSDDSFGSKSCGIDSIYKLLNHCKTNQGKRLLSQWIKQPLLNKNLLQERLDIVEIFARNDAMSQMVSQRLKSLVDIERLAKKFCNKRATLQDCYKVYQTVKALPLLCECFEEHSDGDDALIREVFTTPFHESSLEFTKYIEMIETTLDMDKVSQLEFRVKSNFDPELERLNALMEEALDEMNEEFESAAKDLGLEQGKVIKLESTSQHGHFFRVTCKAEKNLRGNRRFIQIDTTKAGVRFVTKKLQHLNSKYQENSEMFLEQQSAIVNEILGIASGYSTPMSILGRLIAKLDVLISFAQASTSSPIPFVKPIIVAMETGCNVDASIKLTQCRHPCLEVQEDVSFIPNDVCLQRNKQSFLIITGPNMGGKSTYILQVGISILMAQIGCFVPCTHAEITLVDAILARVGAGDSQVHGVSTFMSEMLEAASILRCATPNSLVLIDELGRGTSTYDGFGLAWAISHELSRKVGSWCLFATHFHELTALADEVDGVVNYHVTALASNKDNEDTLTMLYQVKPGVCDQSFGIHVAECVQFPPRVLEAAKKKARELEDCYITMADENEEDGQVIAAKKRKIKEDGEALIAEYLDKMEQIKGKDDYDNKLFQLKKDVLSRGNEYIKQVLQRQEVALDDFA